MPHFAATLAAVPAPSNQRSAGASRPAAAAPAMLPKYLTQRSGVFYFKRKIPQALWAAFAHRKQIWKSLETTNFREAYVRLQAELKAFELQASAAAEAITEAAVTTVARLPKMTLTMEMIPSLLARHEADMLASDDDELRAGSLRPADLLQRRADLDEYLAYYRFASISNDIAVVAETAAQLLAREVISASPNAAVSQEFGERLLALEVRILEEQRARLDGRRQAAPAAPPPVRLLPTLGEYLVAWEASRIRSIRTLNMARKTVVRWNDIIGAHTPASLITRADAKRFRDALLVTGLASNTVRNRIGLLRAIVSDYHEEHDMEGTPNPFRKIRVPTLKQGVRTKKKRRAFEIAELNNLYRSAVFTEKQLPRGQCGEAAYWMPLMGPFVGARIEEVAQMSLADIEIINGVWTLRICEYDDETQALKTDNSFRRVPIHQTLIQLGFLGYLCRQKRNGETRVFSTLRAENQHGIYSNAVGKWFGRYLDKCGLRSPDIDYHAYRYLFKQRLNQCGVSREVRDALCGHWSDTDDAGNRYLSHQNNQYDFTMLCEGIRKLRYDELQLAHLYVADPYDGVDSNLFTDGMATDRT